MKSTAKANSRHPFFMNSSGMYGELCKEIETLYLSSKTIAIVRTSI
jgi:hypothetical protein